MDPEVKKALEELKANLGKHVDVIARVDTLTAALETMRKDQVDVVAIRKEIDLLKTTVEERDKAIRELKLEGRNEMLRNDPVQDKNKSREMMGMIARSLFFRSRNVEMPSTFKGEVELVRKYNEDCVARATLTPMSTTGSYLVPTVTDLSIQSAIEEVSELLGAVDLLTGLPAAGTFNFTFLASRPTIKPARASSDTAMTASDPTFSQMELAPKEVYVTFPVDNKFFDMTPIALGGYFENLTREAMVDQLAFWLLRADGTATYNSITGLLNETTAEYVYTLPAGKKAFADVTATDFRKAKSQCLKRGRGPRGKWIMDLDILGLAEDLDRTGKVPLVTEMPDGTSKIKGMPVVIEEYMPGDDESNNNTGFALVGDPATAVIGMVGGMRIASDSSVKFDKNQTQFRGTMIMDIDRKPVKSMVLMKTANA